MSLIIDIEAEMHNLSKFCLTLAMLGLAASTGSSAIAQMPTELSKKQLEKKYRKLAKLTAKHFAETATIKDGDLETIATISTHKGFSWRGGFTSRVRSDNFLRAFVDKQSGEAIWQLYQTVDYSGEWRRFTSVNIMLPAGLERREVSVIERKVTTCAYGSCAYIETVGFELAEEELEALVAASDKISPKPFRFKFRSQNGFDWTDDLSIAEIQGALDAVEGYRIKNKLN